MAMIRWEPVGELSSLQTEMNRLFGSFFDTAATMRDGTSRQSWVPAMDLIETDEHFVVQADLPGLAREDVSLELEDRVLTISGERKVSERPRDGGYYRIERPIGAFTRSLTLPAGVDSGAVQADLDKGVLVIRIPKPEERKPRRLAIGISGRPATIEGSADTA